MELLSSKTVSRIKTSSLTPEEKFRNLIEDLGKPTLRGVRRCPKCGTLNGTRGISCKNKNCDVVFREREKKKGHSADSVKIITGSTVQVYSVRLRDRGPDYRGFVQLPLVQDLDGNPAENVDPIVLESAGRCYVDSCTKAPKNVQQTACLHIKGAVNCGDEAIPLTLKNSVLNSLQVPNQVKQDIWFLATETSGPLVQRVTKNIMVVKCTSSTRHPLGFLHFSFFETSRNREEPEHKFQCSCRLQKLRQLLQGIPKDETPKRCVHFYACICAFASDEKLAEEFAYYINLDEFSCTSPVDLIATINAALPPDSETDTFMAVPSTSEVEELPPDDIIASVDHVHKSDTISLKEVAQNVEMIVDADAILSLHHEHKRMKTEDLILGSDALAAGQGSLTLTDSSVILMTSDVAPTKSLSTHTHSVPVKKTSVPKTPPVKSVSTPKKTLVVDESETDLSFQQWLGSVTERINQTMHYQFDGNPDPLVFHSSQKFFDCIQQRISSGSKKKRLPNFTTGFVRKDALPLGTFIKYTWYITSIFHVKQIFDTPVMTLEITRSFVENRDGTYDLYESPKIPETVDSLSGNAPIRPFELKTFLKVGMTSCDQKEPTPFVIEWIPDILPKSHIGELRIKFEYGHQRNGQIDERGSPSTSSNESEVPIQSTV